MKPNGLTIYLVQNVFFHSSPSIVQTCVCMQLERDCGGLGQGSMLRLGGLERMGLKDLGVDRLGCQKVVEEKGVEERCKSKT